jgi:hypothetical protein
MVENGIARKFTNKKELMSLMGNKERLIEKFIRENKLKISAEEDLIKIIIQYESYF